MAGAQPSGAETRCRESPISALSRRCSGRYRRGGWERAGGAVGGSGGAGPEGGSAGGQSALADPPGRRCQLKPPASPGKRLTACRHFAARGVRHIARAHMYEKFIERAHKAAQGMGKSLNQAVRDDLEQLAAGEEGQDDDLEALRSMAGRGNSGGQRSSRDELYAERLERQRGASLHRHQHSR
jgi:hypothetical protein